MKHKSAIISKTVHLRIPKLHVLQIFLGTFILKINGSGQSIDIPGSF